MGVTMKKYKPCKYCGRFVESNCAECPKCGRVNPYAHTLPLAVVFALFFFFFSLAFIVYDFY